MNAVPADTFTEADLFRVEWPPDWRVELIDGELVVSHAPGWNHQEVVGNVVIALKAWAGEHGGRANAGIGVIYGPPDNVIPDAVWISDERFERGLDEAQHLRELGPELVVEVVSPGRANAERDREGKLALYGRRDALEYWIVDPSAHTVEQYGRVSIDEPLRLTATVGGDDELRSSLLTDFAVSLRKFWT
jgi:Uma2 family endonuclease